MFSSPLAAAFPRKASQRRHHRAHRQASHAPRVNQTLARVSTLEQDLDVQIAELKGPGCDVARAEKQRRVD